MWMFHWQDNIPLENIDVHSVCTRWPYIGGCYCCTGRTSLFENISHVFPFSSLSFSFLRKILMLHSLVFISFNSLFIALTNIQSETHSRDRCGLAVLSPVSYFAEVISAGLSCILMQSDLRGWRVWREEGGGCFMHFSTNISTNNMANFHLWKLLKPLKCGICFSMYICISVQFITTVMHRSQHCCSPVVWLNWW